MVARSIWLTRVKRVNNSLAECTVDACGCGVLATILCNPNQIWRPSGTGVFEPERQIERVSRDKGTSRAAK